jgi:CubicO group peptidase (beta-lactamase class C family)
VRSATDIRRKADEYVSAYVQAGRFSGCVLLARDGETIFEKAYGLASIEHEVPNTLETRFKIHSTTKLFTATGIMLLAQEGRLRVEDAVRDHLPECPDAWSEVTLHHLLTHTSGIPDFTNAWADAWEGSNSETLLRTLPRLKEPGPSPRRVVPTSTATRAMSYSDASSNEHPDRAIRTSCVSASASHSGWRIRGSNLPRR